MFQQSRICVLGLVCAFLALCLVYFNSGVFERKLETISQIEDEKHFPFMKAMRSIDNKSDPCGGRYVYVHDLPSRFNDDMVKDCGNINERIDMCKFVANNGFGPALNDTEESVFLDNGWYATNQFTLGLIFNTRMKQYECLTNDSSVAAVIFVPFYAGFDASRYLWGYNVSTRDAASFDLIDWLQKRDEWKIMNGKDHFLVGGRPTWDFRRSTDEETGWGNKFLLLPAAKNMSMLSIESNAHNSNDFAIPYPTYFHPSKDSDVFNWQERVMKLERKWLFCFVGVPRPQDPNSIRSLLIDQCRNSSAGKYLECGVGEINCHSPSRVMKMFQSSVFCLQPQGDTYTRRSAFDSILAGCIPVFFHPGSFYTQYTWHIPSNYPKYSVFIPKDDIRRNISIEQTLNQIDPKALKMMRQEVINLIPRLIYADPRSKLETLKDAFDVSIEAIIHKVTKLRQEMIEGRTSTDSIEEDSWKYALLEQGDNAAVRKWDPFFH